MLRRFFSYYRPHCTLFAVDFGCAVVAGLLELAFPMAVRSFIDRLLPGHDWALIVLATGGLALMYLLATALTGIVTYWGHMLGINIETEMRRRAFDHLQKLSFRFYDETKTGHLITHVTKDLEDVGEVAHHGPEDLFLAVMTFLGAFALMFAIAPPLALIATCVVPLVTVLSSRYGARMTRNFRALFRQVGVFNARIEENVGGMRVVQAFANEDHERQLFARDNADYRRTKLQAYRMMAASTSITYFGMRFTQLVVMVAGAWFVLHEQLSAGGFVSFLILVGVFLRPVEKINAVLETYPKGVAGFRRYEELLARSPDIVDAPGARDVRHVAGRVRYEGVRFGYRADRPVLDGIDLDIAAGETVAFVGPSGAGKTTLCALLPRFYELDSGRITIDGIDIRTMTLASLRRLIGIVQQDVFLFGGTIRENIAYGRLDASEADIVQAARRAQLDETIARMPEGMDTIVGERGVKLSGGQKQRLAIARMFLKDPPILILDEATSALDTATERAIQAALAELSRGRTTLVIAHRLATIRSADRIVVVDESGISEQGTHLDLLASRGAYATLHAAQFEESRRAPPWEGAAAPDAASADVRQRRRP